MVNIDIMKLSKVKQLGDIMKLSKVHSKYGAPIGRAGLTCIVFATRACGEDAKVKLARVRINQGGYDDGGAYWGIWEPLYYASFYDNDGDINECFLRAHSREQAKKILCNYEPLKFYR